jgi:hypothetical protein
MISKDYLSQLRQIFRDKSRPNSFGGKIKKLGKFSELIEEWKPKSLLDYGCGKGVILEYLKQSYPQISVDGYDPAVDLFATVPTLTYDCVFSNDVLEHIEPEYIDEVLLHIDNLSSKYIWLRIDTLPARKILPDGRNAHILLESDSWWNNKICSAINGKIIYQNLSKGKFDVAIAK